MDNKIKQELQEMKYLFGYKAGRVISEQENKPVEEDMDMADLDMDVLDIEDMDDVEFGDTTIKPQVRPDVDTPTKKPKTPYDPKRGPKKNPKAEDEVADVDMPNWLSFDELGLNFED
jgi:outer membrane biosynthesis protein TonB